MPFFSNENHSMTNYKMFVHSLWEIGTIVCGIQKNQTLNYMDKGISYILENQPK